MPIVRVGLTRPERPQRSQRRTSTEDESKDLRKYLPIMASARADYIGKDTTGSKVVKVKDPSQVVEFIRKGPSGTPVPLRPVEQPKI